MKKRELYGLTLAVATILIWGVTFVCTKALLADFSSFEILYFRFTMAYAALWMIKPRRLKIDSWEDECILAGAGISGVAIYQLFENIAIHCTNASNVSIIVSICPMITALMSHIFRGEKSVTPRFITGFIIAMTGVAMVTLNGVMNFQVSPVGDLLAVGASISWGFYSILVSEINKRNFDPLAGTRRIFFWAVVTLTPILLFGISAPAGSDFHVETNLTVNAARFSNWLNLVNLSFLGILASAGCFAAWNKACGILGTVKTTLGIYLIPVVTIIFAFAFLGETMSLTGWIGAVLTLLGVICSGGKRNSGSDKSN